jgi:hypothetical protein
MAELRISELVDTTVAANTEVAPDIRRGLELHALDHTEVGLKPSSGFSAVIRAASQ